MKDQSTYKSHPLVVNIHHKKAFDVYVGRGKGSSFGNPYSHMESTSAQFKVATREESIQRYKVWLLSQPDLVARVKRDLRGKRLGCWCAPKPCHADILAEIANADSIAT